MATTPKLIGIWMRLQKFCAFYIVQKQNPI